MSFKIKKQLQFIYEINQLVKYEFEIITVLRYFKWIYIFLIEYFTISKNGF